jgi:hypothetical protein
MNFTGDRNQDYWDGDIDDVDDDDDDVDDDEGEDEDNYVPEQVAKYSDLVQLFKNETGKNALPSLDELDKFAVVFDNYEEEGIDPDARGSFEETFLATRAEVTYEPYDPNSSANIKMMEKSVVDTLKAYFRFQRKGRLNNDEFKTDIKGLKSRWVAAKQAERAERLAEMNMQEKERESFDAIESQKIIMESMRINLEAEEYNAAASGSFELLPKLHQLRSDIKTMVDDLPTIKKGVRDGNVSQELLRGYANDILQLKWKRNGLLLGIQEKGLRNMALEVLKFRRGMRMMNKEQKEHANAFIYQYEKFKEDMETEREDALRAQIRNHRLVAYHDALGGGYLPDDWEPVIVIDDDTGKENIMYRNTSTQETMANPPVLQAARHEHGETLRRQNIVQTMIESRLRNLKGKLDEELLEKENWRALERVKDEAYKVALDLTYSWFNDRRSDETYLAEQIFVKKRIKHINYLEMDALGGSDDEDESGGGSELTKAEKAAQTLQPIKHQYVDLIGTSACDTTHFATVGAKYHFPCTKAPPVKSYPSICVYIPASKVLVCPTDWHPPNNFGANQAAQQKKQQRRGTGGRRRR